MSLLASLSAFTAALAFFLGSPHQTFVAVASCRQACRWFAWGALVAATALWIAELDTAAGLCVTFSCLMLGLLAAPAFAALHRPQLQRPPRNRQ